jgi:hypothetical protein
MSSFVHCFARSAVFAASVLVAVAAAWQPAAACNPQPPRHAVLEGYPYDAMAAEYLIRDARSVVAARLAHRLDLQLDAPGDAPGDAPARPDYVFEVIEGWQDITPRRIAISGYWVSCNLQLRAGRVFILYLEGERLLHAVPVEEIDFELALLGEPGWFYDARGRLVEPEEVEPRDP